MTYLKYDTHIERKIQTVNMKDKDGNIVRKEIDMGDMMIAVASCPKCGATLITQPGICGSRFQEMVGERDIVCQCGETCHSMPVIDMPSDDTTENKENDKQEFTENDTSAN